MLHGRRGHVRSHRRVRRMPVAPWIVVVVVSALVLSGAGAGLYVALRPTCSGAVTATIIASSGTASRLQEVSRTWSSTEPAVGGRCASVDIESRDSPTIAEALGAAWDIKSGGTAPDVWVPESSAWARHAAVAVQAARMMPELQPSVAVTPTVIAMPKPMAEALGWPGTQPTWQQFVNQIATAPEGWARYGKPEWGPFRFGMTDPQKSTAGLLALMAILDANDDGRVTPEEQAAAVRLSKARAVYEETTDKIFDALASADAVGSAEVLKYVSAFPALEQDVATYNEGNPKMPLVAVYPANGAGDADNPYLILNAPWADPERQRVARSFLAYVRGPDGRKAFLDASFRDANRAPGRGLTQANGILPNAALLPRSAPVADSVKESMDTWSRFVT